LTTRTVAVTADRWSLAGKSVESTVSIAPGTRARQLKRNMENLRRTRRQGTR
jgi:hypothetical protein